MKYSEINPEKLKMSGDRILVRKEKPVEGDPWTEHGKSKILVANGTETGEKDPGNIVEVVSVGEVENMDIISGAYLIHQPFTGFAFSHGKFDYTILSEKDILAVI